MTGTQRPIRARRATLATRVIAVATASALVGASLPARAQGGPGLIRDAEIEQLLKDYTQPLLKAAGLAQQNVRPVIVGDRGFNAFVADGRRIFVNAGALMESETPNQIIGVLAHETGHIAGGHLARLREQLANATTQSILAMILGVGAMVAGARSGNSANNGMSQAGAAAIAGPSQAIQNSLFAYLRAQEDQADRAGVKFLTATGQSAKGMAETFKRLADQTLYQTQGMSIYTQSHPLPSERVAALEGMARASPYWDTKDPPALQARHDLMRAKLYGFLERPDTLARRYPMNDNSLAARYARAISSYRYSDPRSAVAQIDALIHTQPQNPYFHELKGQALLEGGRPAEAIAPLRQAIQLAPSPALIQIMLGQALVATHDKARVDEAVTILQAALTREPEAPDAYSQLAMAYGQKNDLAHADLASAQAAFMRGDMKTAREIAARAKTRFPVGSPGWVKADDIASYKPPQTSAFRR
jgi:predicted Zn-dependent protease